MIWMATTVACLALAFTAREDVASTRAATDAGAVEAHWLYRLAGGHWDTLRWVVAVVACGLVVWATLAGGVLAWVAVGVALGWSGYTWRAAQRNWAIAERLKLAARAAGPGASASSTGAGRGDTASSRGVRP